jgi:hypothetical protein
VCGIRVGVLVSILSLAKIWFNLERQKELEALRRTVEKEDGDAETLLAYGAGGSQL